MADECPHAADVRVVTPSARGCEECLKTGSEWLHLRLCRTCGHAGCCDQSPNRRATKHFRATQHPIIEGYDPPEGWGWCYIDEVFLDLSDRATPQQGPIPRYYWRRACARVVASSWFNPKACFFGVRIMGRLTRILLQTTIPFVQDDWHIGRFNLLRAHLASEGFAVTARDRDPPGAPDRVLSRLDASDFDQLWLFAVDVGDGLTGEDCAGVSRFRQRGGGMMVTRDHMDLGSSVCSLGGVGAAHHFHTKNPEPDPARRRSDDLDTPSILWPNYHSGANGDFQLIAPAAPVHPVLADPEALGGVIRYLPAHPHEGAVGQPLNDPTARVIATGRSRVTGARFNIAVAFERSADGGRAIAQSTFHHFADYNWDPRLGAPSFVSERPGGSMLTSPEAQRSARRYALNIARWLTAARTAEERLEAELDEGLDESFPASDPPSAARRE